MAALNQLIIIIYIYTLPHVSWIGPLIVVEDALLANFEGVSTSKKIPLIKYIYIYIYIKIATV